MAVVVAPPEVRVNVRPGLFQWVVFGRGGGRGAMFRAERSAISARPRLGVVGRIGIVGGGGVEGAGGHRRSAKGAG